MLQIAIDHREAPSDRPYGAWRPVSSTQKSAISLSISKNFFGFFSGAARRAAPLASDEGKLDGS
jgi:hypothetical protein